MKGLLLAMAILLLLPLCEAQCTIQCNGTYKNTYLKGHSTTPNSIVFLTSDLPSVPPVAQDVLMIIQMQGGAINTSDSSSYGSNTGTGNGYTSLGEAGRYQFVIVADVLVNSSYYVVVPDVPLVYSFNGSSPQQFQVLIVPFCDVAIINGSTPVPSWNGSVGGVLAVLANTIRLGNITLQGKGFRGGLQVDPVDGDGPLYESYRDSLSPSGGFYNGRKGEGFIGRPRFLSDPSTYPDGFDCARGAPGNAGGGGNHRDSGGGGGSNAGRGGDGRSSSFSSTNFPKPGIGAAALPLNATQRLFLGTCKPTYLLLDLTRAGGGGGGVSRNNFNNPPETIIPVLSGGGLLYLHAFTSIVPIDSPTPTVQLNGDDGVYVPWSEGGPGGM